MKTNFSLRIKTLTAFLFVAAFSITSCKKESSTQSPAVSEEEAQTISQENAAADAEYDDVTEIGLSTGADMEGMRVAGDGTASGNRIIIEASLFVDLQFKLGPCAVITAEPNDTTFPKTITIDYGAGCLCRDGKFRKGAVQLHFTAPIRRPGAVLTITLRDYYVNRAHIEGVKVITNLSENSNIKYTVQVKDGKVTWPNGRGFAYAGVKVVTQIRGGDTRSIRDDVYSLEGRSETAYNNGVTVVKNTESPLIKAVACNWTSKGVVKIKINDRVLYIDFGNGDCDNKATLKWANGQIEITLP